MATRVLTVVAIGALTFSLAACNRAEAPPAGTTPAATAPAAHAGGHAGGKVFFVQPKNGDTIKSMATFEFGNDQLTIAAVPPGTLTEKDVRPGMTHYHLGVDTDCLPAGQDHPQSRPVDSFRRWQECHRDAAQARAPQPGCAERRRHAPHDRGIVRGYQRHGRRIVIAFVAIPSSEFTTGRTVFHASRLFRWWRLCDCESMDRRETERLLESIGAARAAGERVALATVVRVRGSAYRREGTRMLVRHGRDLRMRALGRVPGTGRRRRRRSA